MTTPSAAPTNFTAPNGGGVDLLFSKTDWTVTEANNATYIGADGSTNTDQTALYAFDLRPYREVHLYTLVSVLSGGTTPKVYLGYRGYRKSGKPAGASESVFYANGQPLAATGGNASILTVGHTAITSAGATGTNDSSPITVTYRPLFAHFILSTSGSPTGLTVETYVYGVR